MHVSSYTLNGRLKGDMQLHTKRRVSVQKSAVRGLTFTLPLDDANIDQALFGPPFYRDIVQESPELFTLFHLEEETTGYTGEGVLTTVSDGGQCVCAC